MEPEPFMSAENGNYVEWIDLDSMKAEIDPKKYKPWL